MATIYQFGPFGLDADAGILFRNAEPAMLGQRAVSLLRLLLERAGAPVSKDDLIEAAWPGLSIEDSNLTVQIAALRRVFEETARGSNWIETLPRRGYRYVGPAVATGRSHSGASPQTAEPLALPDKPSVAVLPFSNLSGDPGEGYFADGMVDDIITGLSRIKWLFVIARNSTFTYKGRAVDMKQVGRELGVRYVLEGSVRKLADRVRITGQLIDTATGAHVWAERYDRKFEDVFALQDEIALSVVGAIEPSLRRAEVERVNASGRTASTPMISSCGRNPTSSPGCRSTPPRRSRCWTAPWRSIPPMRWRTDLPRSAVTIASCGPDCMKQTGRPLSATLRLRSRTAKTTRSL